MPVELLDGQRLQVVLDFAPLLNPSAAPSPATAPAPAPAAGTAPAAAAATSTGDESVSESSGAREGVNGPRASWLLSGGRAGVESRKQRRVGVLLPKESLVSDLKGDKAIIRHVCKCAPSCPFSVVCVHVHACACMRASRGCWARLVSFRFPPMVRVAACS